VELLALSIKLTFTRASASQRRDLTTKEFDLKDVLMSAFLFSFAHQKQLSYHFSWLCNVSHEMQFPKLKLHFLGKKKPRKVAVYSRKNSAPFFLKKKASIWAFSRLPYLQANLYACRAPAYRI